MSLFSPRGITGVIGVVLALIALYLVLEKAGGASQVIGSLAGAAMTGIGTLQGRNVSAYSNTVSGGPA